MNHLRRAAGAAFVIAAAIVTLCCGTAVAAETTQTATFRASDGASLYTILIGEGPIQPRPLIVEFTPYAHADATATFGPEYNRLIVHSRGTGRSSGQWDAIGPRDQQDVSEVLDWACHQPWSNGHIGLLGFSASAMAIYNSLGRDLPCVDAAAAGAGSNELYRDLMYPGGIPNLIPGLAVGAGVLGPALQAKIGTDGVLDSLDATAGIGKITLNSLSRPTIDGWWNDHVAGPGPNTFPILAVTGFYDVESRGAFQNFMELRESHPGTHMAVIGAHDGSPKTLPSPYAEYGRWFDHYLLGRDNGIDREPAVKMLLSKGSHGAMINGDVKSVSADDWPVPGTTWQRLYLGSGRARSASSINDGTFSAKPPAGPWWWPDMSTTQAYPGVTSLALGGDTNTLSTIGAAEAGPLLSQVNSADPVSLTYTTPPLTAPVDSAGPAALDIWLSSTAPEADIHAVIADVWPDGRAFPVAQGRLRTSFPGVDRSRSVIDNRGEIVQPYGNFDRKNYALPLQTREYRVEFWPIGNRFETGHRLRLYLMGTSPFMIPPPPGINFVSSGPTTPTRLLFPVLPGSNICQAASIGAGCS